MPEGPPRTVKTDEVTFKSTGNVPRNKTIELMYASIGYGSGAGKLKRQILCGVW
jgi:transcription elongation factor S-II